MAHRRKTRPKPARPPRITSRQMYRCTKLDWATVLAHHLTPFREALARIDARVRRAELGLPEVTVTSKRDEAFAKMKDCQ